MPTLKKAIESEIEITPHELAELWWKMNSEEQASFFNRLAVISDGNLATQICYISMSSSGLTTMGRDAMLDIGGYAKPVTEA